MSPLKIYTPGQLLAAADLVEVTQFDGAGQNSFGKQQQLLVSVCELIEELKLPTHSTRIGACRRLLEGLTKGDVNRLVTEKEMVQLINTNVELSELRTIFSAANARGNPKEWYQHLKRLITGTHPHVNSKKSTAWDFQFEMFLASVAQLSGYEITLHEPDVVISEGARKFGIAAKRPRTMNGLKNCIEKGARQIARAGFDGIIAVDISLLLADGQSLFANDSEGALMTVKYRVEEFVSDHKSIIKEAARGPLVAGVLLSLHMPATIVDKAGSFKQFASAIRWTIFALTDDWRYTWILEFAEKAQLGLFGQPSKVLGSTPQFG